MPDRGYYEPKRLSPTSLGIVIALHAAAITALALAKMDMPGMKVFRPLIIKDVPIPPEPEPLPEPRDQPQVQPKSQVDYVPPIVPPLPRDSSNVVVRDIPDVPIFTIDPPGRDEPVPQPQPRPVPLPPPPVRVEATMLGSSELQPPYPAAEERAEREGTVSIRVTIGANGRVIRAAKVSATSDAFYRATERHAMRAWRFRPATEGGKPVESSKVITVRFELND